MNDPLAVHELDTFTYLAHKDGTCALRQHKVLIYYTFKELTALNSVRSSKKSFEKISAFGGCQLLLTILKLHKCGCQIRWRRTSESAADAAGNSLCQFRVPCRRDPFSFCTPQFWPPTGVGFCARDKERRCRSCHDPTLAKCHSNSLGRRWLVVLHFCMEMVAPHLKKSVWGCSENT